MQRKKSRSMHSQKERGGGGWLLQAAAHQSIGLQAAVVSAVRERSRGEQKRNCTAQVCIVTEIEYICMIKITFRSEH